MKFLLLLNENERGAHDDIYNVLKELKDTSILTDYRVIPFLALINEGKTSEEVYNIIVETCKDFKPNSILWSHTSALKMSKSQLKFLKSQFPNISMGYWDGDYYQSPYKILPKNVMELCKVCDVVFAQGVGSMTNKMKTKGCKYIDFVPGATSSHRFDNNESIIEKKYDVIMIGNRIKRKIPFLTMPGNKQRIKLAEKFYEHYGARFAVFGFGWNNAPYGKGELPFVEQVNTYKKAKLILGNNNYFAKYYFSNRLPIALTSGVPVLYYREKGFEEIFPKNTPFLFESVDEALKMSIEILNLKDDEQKLIGNLGKEWVLQTMTSTHTFTYMIGVLKQVISKNSEKLENPWIGQNTI